MLQEYVPNVSFIFSLMLQQVFSCCKLQVFYVDVVYVANELFQMFQMLQTYVACVLSGCCIYFTRMLQVFHSDVSYVLTHTLQVFHLDVAYILQWLHTCFPRVSNICCKCFNCFGRML